MSMFSGLSNQAAERSLLVKESLSLQDNGAPRHDVPIGFVWIEPHRLKSLMDRRLGNIFAVGTPSRADVPAGAEPPTVTDLGLGDANRRFAAPRRNRHQSRGLDGISLHR